MREADDHLMADIASGEALDDEEEEGTDNASSSVLIPGPVAG